MPDTSLLHSSLSKTSDSSQHELQCSRMPPRFALGEVVSTPGALEKLLETGTDAFELLARHGRGDWGELSAEDIQANNEALTNEGRLFSSYQLPDKQGKVWVITEWDRSATTLLLPEEY